MRAIKIFLLLTFFTMQMSVATHQNSANTASIIISVPNTCDLESKCDTSDTSLGEVCVFDEKERCLRKFASQCHLQIAACKENKSFNDYSNDYCAMEAYLCEDDYEDWTIFFRD